MSSIQTLLWFDLIRLFDSFNTKMNANIVLEVRNDKERGILVLTICGEGRENTFFF